MEFELELVPSQYSPKIPKKINQISPISYEFPGDKSQSDGPEIAK
jgi:hypothetical protein